MSTMPGNDHAANSKFLTEGLHAWQGVEGETDATCIALAVDANTEATLALAYEQRTIALIEYAKVADDETADRLWVDHIAPRLGLDGDEA